MSATDTKCGDGNWRAGIVYGGPLAVEREGRSALTSEEQSRLILGFLVLGVAARVVRFGLNFPLWEDECFLCYNFIHRGYLDLLRPLDFHQVAPLLFLWTELTSVRLFGYAEWSLRLIPFLFSLGGLFLFRHLAGRLLSGFALVLAVGIFAVAYPGIRYAAEAKQYSADAFVALVLLIFAVEFWRNPRQGRWLWFLAAFVPLAVGMSYPAVFVAGGLSAAVFAVLWRERDVVRREHWLAWGAFNLLLLAGFATLFFLTTANQSGAELSFMSAYWQRAFLPLAEPWKIPQWLLRVHSGALYAYPVGGAHGGSALTFLCCLTALVVLISRRQTTLMLIVLCPVALTLVASALQRYPYGGHVKFSQHLAGPICLLMGFGGAWLWNLHAHHRRRCRRVAFVSVLALLLVGSGSIGRDVAHPYKTTSDMRARAFARWFWFDSEQDCETVSVTGDLKQDFAPETKRHLTWSAMYFVNQAIYSPRHRRRQPFRFDKVTSERPLRCVIYRDPKLPFRQRLFEQWLSRMQRRYDLVGHESFSFPRYGKHDRRLYAVHYLDTFTFAPRSAGKHLTRVAGRNVEMDTPLK